MKSRPSADCESPEVAGLSADKSDRREDFERHEELRDFVHVVTHDLRSPLVNVRGLSRELRMVLTELLEEKAGGKGDSPATTRASTEAVVLELLGHIETSVSRMDGMMTQLAGFSRAACGELIFSPVDLGEVMARVLERKARLIEETGCMVEVGKLPTVWADALALETVFGELVQNALVFLSDERPGRVTIFAEIEGDMVRILVRDNGRGIAERELKRIFLPLRRGGALDRPGEGMGLAVVKALVRRQGGSVSCISTLGEGTTLAVLFPLFTAQNP